MQKQVHVNSYVKKDGTQVKEHFRNIETSNYETYPNNSEYHDMSVNTEQNIDAGEVFHKIGEVLKTVVVIAIELAPIVIKMYQSIKNNGNNKQNIEYLKPQFDTQIKKFDMQVEQIKYDIDNSVKNLVNTKNQKEYLAKYKKLETLWQTYQKVSTMVNRIKTLAKNRNFEQIAVDLEEFTKDGLNQISDINSTDKPNPQNDMTLEENMINIASKVFSPSMKVGGSNLQNAVNDFEYAKKEEHAHILTSRKEILNPELSNLMDSIGIPQDARGVVYDNNSEQSKLLWQSPEIQEFVKMNLQDLISGNTQMVYDIEFIVKSNLEGLSNFFGLQHCKLFNPHITSNGYFMCIIVDYYDFEYRKYTKDILQNTYKHINNWGYSMQEKGYLENQFIIYIILEPVPE